MKIPILQSNISQLIPNAKVLSTIPPDEVISIGCAKQTAYVMGIDDYDDVADNIDMPVTTLAEDISLQYVDADGKAIVDTEPTVLFKRGAPVPSMHGVIIEKIMQHPVKIAIHQNDHIDYIENDPEKDLNVISARLHGGIRKHHDNTQTIEKATIHLHLN